ncbi:uncharacterized protein MEPE_00108 [Melanopsichium pennsylvanicum]|uniref:F-box domain-containing protein n=2 Tax=Melanopsichium pennsylvanicum TaxID=63383 RepID=A0AAJ5C2C0_9BASI|nr:putative protein [Melanopsichium pennsylvanicum 4]SNX81403.1 uncharacterized protein MEPE_00108 [Melanopsichium pennsylvanicum]
MWCPLLMFSASYLLLDALIAFVISRLIYLGFKNGLERLCDAFGARLQARLASRSAPSHAHLLLLGSTTWPSGAPIVPSTQWNGGGIGGTILPDLNSSGSASSILRPLVHRHVRRSERGSTGVHRGTSRGGRDFTAVGSGTTLSTAAQRRDWIAVTDPQLRIEVPVYPGISSLMNALTYEALETRIGLRLLTFARWAANLVGVETAFEIDADFERDSLLASGASSFSSPREQPSHAQFSESTHQTPSIMTTSNGEESIFRQLPEELISHILILAACPSFSPQEPRSCPTNILLLSRRYHNLIIPRLYHSVSLHTPSSFRSFRVTLALHNPVLGKHVRKLQIGSSEFDGSGYCPSALADHGPLAVGIEQMLLASPNLQELSLDLFSMGALHTGTVSRLEKGPQPTRLCTELTTIPYLSLPTFEDLRQLELLVFGMDAATAAELRATLPLLEKLELRLVTRRRGAAFQNNQDTWSPTQLPTFDDEEDRMEDRTAEADIRRGTDEEDVFQLESDMQEFIEALQLLRTWPDGDQRLGQKLQEITVFAWPSAARKLKRAFGDAEKKDAEGASATPIRVELDRGYLLGPRRGAHVLWRKDRALAAWAT